MVSTEGAEPAYAAGSEFDKAWDGDVGTFYDPASWINDAWTQATFNCVATLTEIRFFPRWAWENRMYGGQFKCISDTGSESVLASIIVTPLSGQWTSISVKGDGCKKLKYVGPPHGHANVAEIAWGGVCLDEEPWEKEGFSGRYRWGML